MHQTYRFRLVFRLVCLLAAWHAAPLAFAEVPAEKPGLRLVYEGTFTPVQDDEQPPKKFQLEMILLGSPEQIEMGWTINEQGRGNWSWPERFGVATLAKDGTLVEKDRPSLLVQREEGKHAVPLALPFAQVPDAPTISSKWQVGNLEAVIESEEQHGGYDCWEIDYSSPIGYKRTAWIAKDSRLVIELKDLVFLGPGQKHDSVGKLKSVDELPAEELSQIAESFAAWQKFRSELEREPRTHSAELSPEQITLVRERLPQLANTSAGPLAAILAAAERDAKDQKDRTQSLAHLRSSLIGQELTLWSLNDLSGKSFSAKDLAGKVVVLHFWEYKDTPLEEPYGQVAYVDFLQRRLKDQAVVLGVHVDKRLVDEEARKAAIATAKKLRDFMRLSYPILLDDGRFLKQVGDPRPLGGRLPLYVVIGRDGKVLEHHAGMYEVQRERGLEALETIVTGANAK